MNALTAEERLAQFSFLSLTEREVLWAEIAQELDRSDDLELRRLPAPITLRFLHHAESTLTRSA